MVKITVFMVVYNEEKRIGNMLNMLTAFDDVLILDKSSNDATCQIAKEYGAKVLSVPYYNDTAPVEIRKRIKEALYNMQDSGWIFSLVASDIVHCQLYNEMQKALQNIPPEYKVVEVPIKRYSLGASGKNSLFGNIDYKPLLKKRELFSLEIPPIHTSPYDQYCKFRLHPKRTEIAVYHLSHPNLEHVMDRHLRYATQYVEDYENNGKNREQIMKYAWHEIIRVIFLFFGRRGYKLKWDGLAQCMMLIMYNTMIYLNAYFSREKEVEIEHTYQEVIDMCKRPI